MAASKQLSLYDLTTQQRAFLNALANDARGDLKLAKDLAGYSPNTQMVDVIRPLKDHILVIIKDTLLNSGIKAAFAIDDVLMNPASMGAANKIKAATEILDRIGVVKPETEIDTGPKAAIFILPEKQITSINVDNGKVTIDMNTDKLIEYDDIEDELDEPEISLDNPSPLSQHSEAPSIGPEGPSKDSQ